MPTVVYPRRSVTSPDAEMLRPPATPISKCWEADLSPLTQLKGSLDQLPKGEATLALLIKCSAEGSKCMELSVPCYERQPVDLHPHQPGRPTSNIHSIVFHFEEQPNSAIPLIGLYVDRQLVMRGGLTRLLVLPESADLSGPQVRFEAGALRVRFT